MEASRSDFRNLDQFNPNAIRSAFQDPLSAQMLQRFVTLKEEDEQLLSKIANSEKIERGIHLFSMKEYPKFLSFFDPKKIKPSEKKSGIFTIVNFGNTISNLVLPVSAMVHTPLEGEDEQLSTYKRELLQAVENSEMSGFDKYIVLGEEVFAIRPADYSTDGYYIRKIGKKEELLSELESEGSVTNTPLKFTSEISGLKSLYNSSDSLLSELAENYSKLMLCSITIKGKAVLRDKNLFTNDILITKNSIEIKEYLEKIRFSLGLKGNAALKMPLLDEQEAEGLSRLERMGYLKSALLGTDVLRRYKLTDLGIEVSRESDLIKNFMPMVIPEHAERANWKEYYKFAPVLPFALHIGSALGSMVYENPLWEDRDGLRYVLGSRGLGKTFAILQALAELGVSVEYHTFKNEKEQVTHINNKKMSKIGVKMTSLTNEDDSGFNYSNDVVKEVKVFDDFHYLCDDVIAGRKPKSYAIEYLNKVVENKETPSVVVSNEPLETYSYQIGPEFLEGVQKLNGKVSLNNYIEVGEINWATYKDVAEFYVKGFNATIDPQALYLLYNTTPNYRVLARAINALDGNLSGGPR